MKLVIDIPEDDYELVQKYIFPQRVFYALVHATPLKEEPCEMTESEET